MKKVITVLIIGLYVSGCSTLRDSLIVGAGSGAAVGGLLGNAKGTGKERNRNTNKGLLIGAALGAGISYLAYKTKKKKTHLEQQKSINKTEDIPLLTQPKIKRVWVEDKINGKRFIKGHWEYVIEENSAWSSK